MVDKSEKFRWLVRLGFAARGLVYLLIGYLALTAERTENGPENAFDWLQDVPLGVPILYLAAAGLLGYGLYRLCSLLFDVENHGTNAEGIAMRVGHGASGLAHLMLAWTAFQFAQGAKQAPSGGATEEAAAATLLSFSFGSLVLGLIGIAFVGAAIMQGKLAETADFMKETAPDAPAIVKPLGRAGYAARAVVFLVIGWSLIKSGWFGSARKVESVGDAMGTLAGNYVLFTFVAVGLVVFGLFSLLLARYRIVPDISRADIDPRAR